MKLYLITENQLRGVIDKAREGIRVYKVNEFETEKEFEFSENNIVNSLTPIQLPSDEDIEKEAFKVIPKFMTDPYNPLEDGNKEDRDVLIKGIKWMKEQILNQIK